MNKKNIKIEIKNQMVFMNFQISIMKFFINQIILNKDTKNQKIKLNKE